MCLLNYSKTFFLQSFSKTGDIKYHDGFEIAFVGYSNVGKSSVINTLTNQKKLARFSKTPGRTQLINFFEVVSDFRIVDLPGYGYSSVPIYLKLKWCKLLYDYLERRDQLKGIVLCMDIRYPLKMLDQKIIDIVVKNKYFLIVLLTKCDKLKKSQNIIQLNFAYKALSLLLDNFEIEVFSSFKKIGLKYLKKKLNIIYNNFHKK